MAAAVGLGDVDVKGWPRLRAHSPIFWKDSGLFPVPMEPWFHDYDVCEFKWYGPGTGRFLLRSKALAIAAYQDYFPATKWTNLRSFISSVIVTAVAWRFAAAWPSSNPVSG